MFWGGLTSRKYTGSPKKAMEGTVRIVTRFPMVVIHQARWVWSRRSSKARSNGTDFTRKCGRTTPKLSKNDSGEVWPMACVGSTARHLWPRLWEVVHWWLLSFDIWSVSHSSNGTCNGTKKEKKEKRKEERGSAERKRDVSGCS